MSVPILPDPPPAQVLSGHGGPVLSVALAVLPDGKSLLATGSKDSIGIWIPTTGQQVHVLTTRAESLALAVLSNGKPVLATSGGDGTVQLWDAATRQHVHTLTADPGLVRSVALAALPDDALLLAIGNFDGKVRVMRFGGEGYGHILTGHAARVVSVALTVLTDGTLMLASASHDGTVRVWNPATGEHLHTLTGRTPWVRSVALTLLPDGTPLLASGDINAARLWNVASRTQLVAMPHAAQVTSTAFHGTDERVVVVTGCDDHYARIWHLDLHQPDAPPSGRTALAGLFGPVAHELTGHQEAVRSLAMAVLPDDTALLASGSDDTTSRLESCHRRAPAHPHRTYRPRSGRWR